MNTILILLAFVVTFIITFAATIGVINLYIWWKRRDITHYEFNTPVEKPTVKHDYDYNPSPQEPIDGSNPFTDFFNRKKE